MTTSGGLIEPGAILIAGPTASGKSALALRLAERHRGVVINADAMAVYRDLRVLTARPDDADLRRAPHALYGHVDAAVRHSVGLWLADAEDALRAARATNRVPIIVGGTGLYVKALTQGLSDIPPVPEHVRAKVHAEAAGRKPEALHALLSARDPRTAARLRPTDPQRILRALEVFEATGRSLSSFQARQSEPLLAPSCYRGVVLAPERGASRVTIDSRFDAMMEKGALAEVEALAARRLDPALPAMRALGVPPFLAYLAGGATLEAAIVRAKAETRRYFKRQMTFARHQLPGFDWAATPAEAEAAIERGLSEAAG